ncbi:MAG: hypothetical protein A3E83_08280 [Gammaproteobacteria bacterium RIFCSPHIGHO2_12_FULL_41_20]|nr:MAG: hypothetical protein A3E83_08280 [Gammaproteobacteria bacterium RIFCSPHIGHO2_12_FULL_41_20]
MFLAQETLTIKFIKSPYFFLAVLLLVLACYFFIDLRVAIIFYHIKNSWLVHVARIITRLGDWTYYIKAALLLYLIAKIFKKPQLARFALFIVLTITVSGLLCDGMKVLCGRARPTLWFNKEMYGFYFLHTPNALLSFPSGHATVITSAMVALSLAWRRYASIFVGLLLVVSFSRVVVGAHYMSDILMGIYIGTITSILLYQKVYKNSH